MARRTKQTTPEPVRPTGYRQTMHLGLYTTDLENLDKVVAIMKRERGSHLEIGRAEAARHAIAQFVEHPRRAGRRDGSKSARSTQTG